MRRALSLTFVALLAWMTVSGPAPTLAAGSGPEIAVGTPSLVAGKVQVPILAEGAVDDAYAGVNVHVRWDPAIFQFSSASAAGGIFDPGASPATGLCLAPDTTRFDADGGGVVVACAGYAGTTQTNGLLATLTLTPVGSGCSNLHLWTFGGPDGGDELSGTYTVDSNDPSPQANAYADGTADDSGAACVPPAGARGSTPAANGAPPAQAQPQIGNCTYDAHLDGKLTLLDVVTVLQAFGATPGQPKWNSAYDLDASLSITFTDVLLILGQFGYYTTSGCVPAYPYYNPGVSWDGSLPAGYNSSTYYVNTGAMVYTAGSYDCSALFPALSGWAFDSPTSEGSLLSACAAAGDLAGLINSIAFWDYAHGLPGSNQVFFGPNDCMSLFTPPRSTSTIAAAASVLFDVVSIAIAYSQQNDNGNIHFAAAVDDEGYFGSCDRFSVAEGQCESNDQAFFVAYGGPIGPAGARPCEAGDEELLSEVGHGLAIPQAYVDSSVLAINPFNNIGCIVDRQGPAAGAWPYTIASGYAGVQSFPHLGEQFTSYEANIRWSRCHGAPPMVGFDWSFPGGRG